MARIPLMTSFRFRVLVQVTTVEDWLSRSVSLCRHASAGRWVLRQAVNRLFDGIHWDAGSWLDADLLDCYHSPLFKPQKRRIKNQTFMSTTPIKIFVADEVSDSGLQPLRDAGFSVEKRTGLSASELGTLLPAYAGLVVRSETKVSA